MSNSICGLFSAAESLILIGRLTLSKGPKNEHFLIMIRCRIVILHCRQFYRPAFPSTDFLPSLLRLARSSPPDAQTVAAGSEPVWQRLERNGSV